MDFKKLKYSLESKKIVVRMPNWIGDFVMALPVIHTIKKCYPTCHLTVMCKTPLQELIKHDPHVDAILTFDKKALKKQGIRKLIASIRRENYDIALLLTHSFSSAWWFWLARVKVRIGYRGHFRKWLLTEKLEFSSDIEEKHLVTTYLKLLDFFGLQRKEEPPQLFVEDEEKVQAIEKLEKCGIKKNHVLIGINPGAAYGSAKCWIPERFTTVAKKLLHENPNFRLVFFGDLSGKPLVDHICTSIGDGAINLAGQTHLRELMSMIASCRFFLTNDSGPMHLADALKVPLLALFGSTNPIKTGPYIQRNIIQKKVSCSPCYKRVCPIDFKCMKGIQVDEVYEKVKVLLLQN